MQAEKESSFFNVRSAAGFDLHNHCTVRFIKTFPGMESTRPLQVYQLVTFAAYLVAFVEGVLILRKFLIENLSPNLWKK